MVDGQLQLPLRWEKRAAQMGRMGTLSLSLATAGRRKMKEYAAARLAAMPGGCGVLGEGWKALWDRETGNFLFVAPGNVPATPEEAAAASRATQKRGAENARKS